MAATVKLKLSKKGIANATENDERAYLDNIRKIISTALSDVDRRVNRTASDLQEQKKYIWENKGEKNGMHDSVFQTAASGEAAVAKKNKLHKLINSPYFGRIDFIEPGHARPTPLYIGIHSFFDAHQNSNLIYDWRAPISSMFYDHETGVGSFESPAGTVKGNILLKRQYRIVNGKMEFMLESSEKIHDDILQRELSRVSDEKMKDIIGTIQRDQNAIIRNELSRALIIQGVAGSGKTSIALHRVAFLLYRHRGTISSKNVLIISPNKVFADYISNVLPELGEEKIPEIGIDGLANELLGYKYKFQTFFEQVSLLLEKTDESFSKRIEYKSSFEFLGLLEQYITHLSNECFAATTLKTRFYTVGAEVIAEKFLNSHRLPLLKRYLQVTDAIAEHIRVQYKYALNAKEKGELKKAIISMFKTGTLRELYKQFYSWLGKPDLLKTVPHSTFEYTDVFPLLYLKMRLEGYSVNSEVKHLLIDEMQDYTPVQFAVLSRLFPCKKTILGDTAQSVNPYSAFSAEKIQKIFPGADYVKLCKSYRSTYEIIKFSQAISLNEGLIAIERHGEKPSVIALKDEDEEIEAIKKLMSDFENSSYRSLGIICKTQKQVDWLNECLAGSSSTVLVLTTQSTKFSDGVVITTAHLAKGLEFDWVIVPFASSESYQTEIDKSMLYVACTRAMHRLSLTHSGKRSTFVVPVS